MKAPTRTDTSAAFARVQETLLILVKAVSPQLEDQLPAAVRVAPDGESPDLASRLVVADPIGAGFTLSQADLGEGARFGESMALSSSSCPSPRLDVRADQGASRGALACPKEAPAVTSTGRDREARVRREGLT